MNLGLKGRVALVTGSSDGIGNGIAFRLAEEGADLIIHGRDPFKVKNVARTTRQMYKMLRVYEFVADLSRPDQIKNWFETEMPAIGQLDILVNNVGGMDGIKRFEEVTDEEWFDSFAFNFMSAVRFTRLALPYLKKSNQARIINLGTDLVIQPGLNNPHYSAPKTALVNLSKYLSTYLAENGITVNTVCPKSIMGGAWHRDVKNLSETEGITLDDAEKQLQELAKAKIPLKRVGTVVEVADTIVFLASKRASFITGECIFVDGGTKRSIF